MKTTQTQEITQITKQRNKAKEATTNCNRKQNQTHHITQHNKQKKQIQNQTANNQNNLQ